MALGVSKEKKAVELLVGFVNNGLKEKRLNYEQVDGILGIVSLLIKNIETKETTIEKQRTDEPYY